MPTSVVSGTRRRLQPIQVLLALKRPTQSHTLDLSLHGSLAFKPKLPTARPKRNTSPSVNHFETRSP
jgi:hypothetical protein